MNSGLVGLILAWTAYFALHSLLASLGFKRYIARRWPDSIPAYRIAYNLLATALLVPCLYFTYALPGEPLWSWRGAWAWVANLLALGAVAGVWYSARYYDIADFLGIRRWLSHDRRVEDIGTFSLSPLHRFVRHPWYSLALVLIWTRDMSPALLVTSVLITSYLWYGSRLEERKLIVFHGPVYREYQQRVPGLLPNPFRYLTAQQAERLRRVALSSRGVGN